MYPEPIEHFFVPETIAEVVALLREHPTAKLLAGGQSLVPLMRARLLCPPTLVDINHVSGLDSIEAKGDNLRIGALVRYRDVLRHRHVNKFFAALADAAASIGDRQVRNRGTVIGNVAQRDHTGDIAPVAMIFDSMLESARDGGEVEIESLELFARKSPADGTPTGHFIQHIELHNGTPGSAFIKHGRVAQDRTILSVAAALRYGSEGRCTQVRVAIGGVAPTPLRIAAVEIDLESNRLDKALLVHLGQVAAAAIAPQDDPLASAAYRTQLIRTTVPAAISKAIERAGGTIP